MGFLTLTGLRVNRVVLMMMGLVSFYGCSSFSDFLDSAIDSILGSSDSSVPSDSSEPSDPSDQSEPSDPSEPSEPSESSS